MDIKIFEDKQVIRLASVVLVIGCAFAAYYGFARGSNLWLGALLAGLGICVVWLEAISAHRMAVNFVLKQWGALTACAVVWIACASYSLVAAFGIAANNQVGKASMQKAAHSTFVDNGKQKAELEGKVTALTKRIAYLEGREGWQAKSINDRPVRTADAAQADIDKAKAHRFWGVTGNCAETKGPQTRQFCADYRAALAEKDVALEIAKLKDQLAAAEGGLSNARAKMADGPTVMSENVPVAQMIADMTGMEARWVDVGQSLQTTGVVTIILTLAWFMLGLKVKAPPTAPPARAAEMDWRPRAGNDHVSPSRLDFEFVTGPPRQVAA